MPAAAAAAEAPATQGGEGIAADGRAGGGGGGSSSVDAFDAASTLFTVTECLKERQNLDGHIDEMDTMDVLRPPNRCCHGVRPQIHQMPNPSSKIKNTLSELGYDSYSWRVLTLAELSNVFRIALRIDWFVVNPTSKYVLTWDFLMTLALLFTIFVTPVEVAWMNTTPDDNLWWINRAVDCCFIKDMVMNFFLIFRKADEHGNMTWITDRALIARKYFRGWFLPDLLSVLPFDIWIYMQGGSNPDNQSYSRAKILRTIRLLRMVKLVRVVRSSRIFLRMEDELELVYWKVSLLKFSATLICAAHLMACAFGGIGKIAREDRGSSWFEFLLDNKGSMKADSNDVFKQYICALYWSVMTLTSVGYGDASPHWPEEYVVVIFLMLIGGCTWAYNLGALCSVVGGTNEPSARFQRTMDNLSSMASSRRLNKSLRQRLRQYLWKSQGLYSLSSHNEITKSLSPVLQGEVYCNVAIGWLNICWLFNGMEIEFVQLMAKTLTCIILDPKETLEPASNASEAWATATLENVLSEGPDGSIDMSMYFIERGTVALKHPAKSSASSCLASGQCFFEDRILLIKIGLLDDSTAIALNFTSVLKLEKASVDALRPFYPTADAALTMKSRRLAAMRNLKVAARMVIRIGYYKGFEVNNKEELLDMQLKRRAERRAVRNNARTMRGSKTHSGGGSGHSTPACSPQPTPDITSKSPMPMGKALRSPSGSPIATPESSPQTTLRFPSSPDELSIPRKDQGASASSFESFPVLPEARKPRAVSGVSAVSPSPKAADGACCGVGAFSGLAAGGAFSGCIATSAGVPGYKPSPNFSELSREPPTPGLHWSSSSDLHNAGMMQFITRVGSLEASVGSMKATIRQLRDQQAHLLAVITPMGHSSSRRGDANISREVRSEGVLQRRSDGSGCSTPAAISSDPTASPAATPTASPQLPQVRIPNALFPTKTPASASEATPPSQEVAII